MDVEIEIGSKVEVCIKRRDFLPVSPPTHQPVQRQLTGQELDCNPGMLKCVRGKPDADVETRRRGPMHASQLPVTRGGGMDPAQNLGSAPTIMVGKPQIPHSQ